MNVRLNNKGIQFLLILVPIFLIGLITIFILIKKETRPSSVSLIHDLIDHPIYSHYDFDDSESVINIGIQPMYLPTGIIFEVIKRDNILKQALMKSQKEIKYYSFLKGADVNFFLQCQILDGGVGGDMPALSAASSFGVCIPAILQKGNVSIVSFKPSLTKDLNGKRIGYPYGSISHYFLLELLHSAGITEDNVRLIPMEVSAMANALHNNEIDLFSAWEPIVSGAIKQYPEFYITFRKISTGYLYFLSSFIQVNSLISNHLLAAVIRAISWMKSDNEYLLLACEWNLKEIEKLTGQESILTAEEMADIAKQDILRYYSKYSMVISNEDLQTNSSLYKEYEFLISLSKGNKNNNWEQVVKSFDDNLILEIIKQPNEYNLNIFDYDTDFKEN